MSAHSRRSTLYGPHAVLHRHRRPATARPNPREVVMKPSPKQLVKGGQGRTAEDVRISSEAALVAAMTCGLVALIVVLGHVAGWLQ